MASLAALSSHSAGMALCVLVEWPNPSVNRTPGKLRLPVTYALRARVAGYLYLGLSKRFSRLPEDKMPLTFHQDMEACDGQRNDHHRL